MKYTGIFSKWVALIFLFTSTCGILMYFVSHQDYFCRLTRSISGHFFHNLSNATGGWSSNFTIYTTSPSPCSVLSTSPYEYVTVRIPCSTELFSNNNRVKDEVGPFLSPAMTNTSWQALRLRLPRRSFLSLSQAIPSLKSNQSLVSETIVAAPVVRKQITLMETSSKEALNARQACAVESAAKENPHMDVVLYVTSEKVNLKDPVMKAVSSLRNVRFQQLDLDSYFLGTKLEKWYKSDKRQKSKFAISHMSDALRFLILYNHGGIYLDLDVVVLKSLDDLENCSGVEDSDWVAAGVMAFDQGHPFIDMCIEEFAQHYDGVDWGANGPKLFTRVIRRVCKVQLTKLTDTSRSNCMGVIVLPQNAFYAISWKQWKLFFDEEHAQQVMTQFNGSYVVHVWNMHSATTNVTIGSGQPYELVAKKHCPSVYKAVVSDGYF